MAGWLFYIKKGRYEPCLPASDFANLNHSGRNGDGASALGVLYPHAHCSVCKG